MTATPTTHPELNAVAATFIGDPLGEHRAPCPVCARAGRDDVFAILVDDIGATGTCHRCGRTGFAPRRANGANGAAHPVATARSRPAPDFAARWEHARPNPAPVDHPYLTRKRIQPHGLRVDGDVLLVPMRNADKKIVGGTIPATGEKKFAKDPRPRVSASPWEYPARPSS